MPSFTFTRQERLKSRKLIGQLFKAGSNSFVAYPLRAVWTEVAPKTEANSDGAEPAAGWTVQVAIAVPKRNFKSAVARNLLKRRIREAYRLHKHELYEKLAASPAPAGSVALLLMFIGKEELPFAEIEAGVVKMVRKWPT